MTRIIHKTAGPVALVPVEATEDQMRDAAYQVRNFTEQHGPYPRTRAMYVAALAAAPTDPQADAVALVRALEKCTNALQRTAFDRFSDQGIMTEAMWRAGDRRTFDLVTEARAALSRFKVEEDDA